MSPPQERFLFGQENFLIVARGLFPQSVLRKVREQIAQRRATIKVRDARSRQAEEVGVAPDELRLNEEWYQIWKAADLATFRDYAPDFSEAIYPPQIRTVRNLRALVPWHQDATYMKALGNRGHAEVVSCFLPLDEDPENRPTLQFCIDPDQKPVEAVIRDGTVFNKFDLAQADVPPAGKCHTFKLGLGDAFVFGQHVLHRTYVASDRFAERTSMEFRLTRPRCVIPGKDYFSLKSMRFYQAGKS